MVPDPSNGAKFPTTNWSVVLTARDSADRTAALHSLCSLYWQPIYAYMRRRGSSVEDAKDLTQEFFLNFSVNRDFLQKAKKEKVKFRTFLLGRAQDSFNDDWRKQNAAKRGGGAHNFVPESAIAEAGYQPIESRTPTPEVAFDLSWIQTLMDWASRELAQSYEQRGEEELFRLIRPQLMGPDPETTNAKIAKSLGRSEDAIKVAVHRMRRRFRKLIRSEIAATVSDPDDNSEVESELQYLREILIG